MEYILNKNEKLSTLFVLMLPLIWSGWGSPTSMGSSTMKRKMRNPHPAIITPGTMNDNDQSVSTNRAAISEPETRCYENKYAKINQAINII